jgi:hypothetical protein
VLDAHELTKKTHVCISQLKIVSAKYKSGYQKLSKSEKLSKFDFDLVFLREGQVCDNKRPRLPQGRPGQHPKDPLLGLPD